MKKLDKAQIAERQKENKKTPFLYSIRPATVEIEKELKKEAEKKGDLTSRIVEEVIAVDQAEQAQETKPEDEKTWPIAEVIKAVEPDADKKKDD